MSYLAGVLLLPSRSPFARRASFLTRRSDLSASARSRGLMTALTRLARSNTMLVGLSAHAAARPTNTHSWIFNAELHRRQRASKLDRILALVPGYSWREVWRRGGAAGVRVGRHEEPARGPRAPFRGPYDVPGAHLMNAVFRRPDNPPDKRTMADKQIFFRHVSGGTCFGG
jgi:hypothetical protein